MVQTSRRPNLINRVRDIVSDLSGMGTESLNENASFLELGFDSLFLTQLSTAFQRAFGLRITFRQLFDDLSSISALSSYLDKNLPPDAFAPVTEPAKPVISEPTQPAPPRPFVATAQPSIPTPAHRPVTTVNAAQVSDLEAILLRQLELMTEQLRLVQGMPAINGSPAPQAQPCVPPPAIEPAIPAPAPAAAAKDSPVTKSSGFGPGDVRNTGLHALAPRQQRHLDQLVAAYTAKTAGSKERTQRYRRAHADPRTAAGFNRRWKEMVYPIWVQRSSGSKLWDVDGNEYIDLLNGFGPNFLGHAPDYVVKAIEDQLHRGFEIGPQTPLVGEAAEMVCQLTGMDRASFVCSGSEAVQAAMRLSRTVVGRDKIVVFSRDYHGNFDQVLVREANQPNRLRTMPSAPGIPFQSVDDTYVLEYGTSESLEIIKAHAGEIAAVIVEPVQSRRPEFQPREFLHELRRITRDAGILLVFDEVITGFRTCPGGAQAYFGIEADLATYGKIVGGGMPIGVVAGRSAVMDTFDGGFWQYGDDSFPSAGATFFAGTFVRHPLAIAAAHAALKHLIKEGPAIQERVNERANRFASRINELLARYALNIEMPHFCSLMYLRIKEQSELANLLYFHLRYRGVHVLEGFPSYMTDAHSEDDIDRLVGAFTDSIESMVEDGIFGNPHRLPKKVASLTAPAPMTVTSAAESGHDSKSGPCSEHPPADTQRDMWVAAQMSDEASAASYGSNVIELIGDLNTSALQQAVDAVLARHEALRSVFAPDGAAVLIKPAMSVNIQVTDLTSTPLSERDREVTAVLEAEVRQAFDLATGPLISFRLLRLSGSHHLLAFTAHMIVCDGWGFQVVLQEISAIYSALVRGRDAALPVPEQMRDYVAWQRRQKDAGEGVRTQKFWVDQFATLPPAFELPTSGLRPPTRTFRGGREILRLPEDLCRNLNRVARDQRSTPFAFLLAAYQAWLHRLSGLDDFVVAVPFAGQSALGMNNLVGQCVHTLPLRARVNGEIPFSELLTATRNFIFDAQENWNSNIGAIVQRLSVPGDPSRLPLSSVMFNLDPPLAAVQFEGCVSRITSGPRYAFHYDLGFNVVDEGSAFLVECDFNSRLFDAALIRAWLDGFQSLLEGVFAGPQAPVGSLPMQPPGQRGQAGSPAATAAFPTAGPARRVLAVTSNPHITIPEIGDKLIVAAKPGAASDAAGLEAAIRQHGATTLLADVAAWRYLLTNGSALGGLEAVCFGNTLPPDVAAGLLRNFGQARFLYTQEREVTIAGPVVMGHPVLTPTGRKSLRVVERSGGMAPLGVPGLLEIDQVSTGALARCLPTGAIELLGEPARYVTLDGHRIGLASIEVALFGHSAVHDAAVCLRDGLTAYVCLRPGDDAKEEIAALRRLLRNNLPAYLHPAAIVRVGAIPRTASGEVDIAALPAPGPDDLANSEAGYIAPRNPAEERLAALWCEILKLDRISVNESFFALGGQSLLAVSLFGRIEKEFGRKLPLAVLFTSPTIEDIALLLTDKGKTASWSSLVPIQPKGSKPPLFLVHGAGGNILLYRSLGEHLAPDYPLYGLQSQGLDGTSTPLSTIEDMARSYLREVRHIQPRGPYYLGGYCLGGTIAYEMAQILKSEGEDVPLVAMLDTYNFSRALRVSFRSFLLQKMRFHAANLLSMGPRDIYAYLREKLRLLRGGELAHLRNSMPGGGPQEGTSRATCGIEASIQALNDNAAETYVPRPYPGELTLFKPRLNYKFYPDPNMGWGDLAVDGLDIIEVTENPHSMLLEPYVKTLAGQLKGRIDAASSARSVLRTLEREVAPVDLRPVV